MTVVDSGFSSNLAVDSIGEKVSRWPQNLEKNEDLPPRGAGDSRPL